MKSYFKKFLSLFSLVSLCGAFTVSILENNIKEVKADNAIIDRGTLARGVISLDYGSLDNNTTRFFTFLTYEVNFLPMPTQVFESGYNTFFTFRFTGYTVSGQSLYNNGSIYFEYESESYIDLNSSDFTFDFTNFSLSPIFENFLSTNLSFSNVSSFNEFTMTLNQSAHDYYTIPINSNISPFECWLYPTNCYFTYPGGGSSTYLSFNYESATTFNDYRDYLAWLSLSKAINRIYSDFAHIGKYGNTTLIYNSTYFNPLNVDDIGLSSVVLGYDYYSQVDNLKNTIDNLSLEIEELNNIISSYDGVFDTFSLISASFQGLIPLLNVELAPNITLGMLLTVPFVISLILLAFRLIS